MQCKFCNTLMELEEDNHNDYYGGDKYLLCPECFSGVTLMYYGSSDEPEEEWDEVEWVTIE